MPRFHIARSILPQPPHALIPDRGLEQLSLGGNEHYGELLRFNGIGTGTHKGKKFELKEETHAFGVDPVDSSVYVGEKTRVKKRTGSRSTTKKANSSREAPQTGRRQNPPGTAYVEDLDGVAIDHASGVVYVLVSYKRNYSDKIDSGKEVAGAVYAFSTTRNGEELVPAPNADQTGLFASATPLCSNLRNPGPGAARTLRDHGRPRHARSDDPRPG